MTREEELAKYFVYRDRVLKGETLTPDEEKEYHELEARFHQMERSIVVETEADSQKRRK